MGRCQKSGIILENKWFKNWCYQKMSSKIDILNEKKLRKIWLIFHIENWLWEQILALFDTSPLTWFSKFNNFFLVCKFLGKNLSNFENSYCHDYLLSVPHPASNFVYPKVVLHYQSHVNPHSVGYNNVDFNFMYQHAKF